MSPATVVSFWAKATAGRRAATAAQAVPNLMTSVRLGRKWAMERVSSLKSVDGKVQSEPGVRERVEMLRTRPYTIFIPHPTPLPHHSDRSKFVQGKTILQVGWWSSEYTRCIVGQTWRDPAYPSGREVVDHQERSHRRYGSSSIVNSPGGAGRCSTVYARLLSRQAQVPCMSCPWSCPRRPCTLRGGYRLISAITLEMRAQQSVQL